MNLITMLQTSKAFSSFSVDDLGRAKEFYEQTLGLEVKDNPMGILELQITENPVMIYPKPNHKSASFTVLNFPVDDIDTVVEELTEKGVVFEQHNNEMIKTDKKGIARSASYEKGPNVAWFKDPAGNILAVLEE